MARLPGTSSMWTTPAAPLTLALHAPAELVEGGSFQCRLRQAPRHPVHRRRDHCDHVSGEGVHHSHWQPSRTGDAATCDASKIKRVLGWQPEVAWKDGLLATIQWYIDSEDWWRRLLWNCAKFPLFLRPAKRNCIEGFMDIRISYTTPAPQPDKHLVQLPSGGGCTLPVNPRMLSPVGGGA